MTDTRFFDKIEGLTLGEIAKIGEIILPEGASLDRVFTDVASIDKATVFFGKGKVSR